MAALSDIAKYVRPDVAGCADIIILDAILLAGIEFCKRTKVIKETLSITTIVDQSGYALNVATGTEPDEILSVTRGDDDGLDASSFKEFDDYHLNRLSGTPQYFYMSGGNTLQLGKIPNAVETLSAIVKTRPSRDAITLPDELVDRYMDEIASGAKSRLMIMKDKSWTDLQMAGLHKSMFEDAINKTNIRDAKGSARKPLRTKPSYF
ncbi:MAG: hypothetical protein WC733_00130 [Methylophilus sp.]|jgi:hypothetical protein